MDERYQVERLSDSDDNGTMPASRAALAEAVVGHRIVSAEKTGTLPGNHWHHSGLLLTLDNGMQVTVAETGDCCAYTDVQAFLLNPELVDHVILGVGTTDEFTTWHIFADAGDVLEMAVAWSCGNPFYYGYGFAINVLPVAA